MKLDKKKIISFNEKGYIIIPNFFKKKDEDIIFKIIKKFIYNLILPNKKNYKLSDDKNIFLQKDLILLEKENSKITHYLYETLCRTSYFINLFINKKIIKIVTQLMNCNQNNLYCNSQRLRIDPPGDRPYRLQWHQEASYANSRQIDGIQYWSPLFFNASLKNGTIEIYEGSHLEGLIPTQKNRNKNKKFASDTFFINEKKLSKKYKKIKIKCKSKTIVIFSTGLVHRSSDPKKQTKMKYSITSRFENINSKNFSP